MLCQQEFFEHRTSPDILLVQDPPSSVMGGKNIFSGYRIVKAPGQGQGLGKVAIAFRTSLRCRGLRPFGPRVVLVEVAGTNGPIILISAYIRYSSGEGLEDLEAALRWAKGRCPRVLLGLDGNGHSPWWGPSTVVTNPVGSMLEDFIVDHDLEVLNDCHSSPSFVSDMGDRTWIDITLATRSLALSLFNWRVESEFFAGSDHRPIFFTLDSTPLRTEVFKCKAWERANWGAFAASVAQGCQAMGLLGAPDQESAPCGESPTIEDQVTRLTMVLQRAIATHVPEKTICWASKPWWSPEVAEARQHMRHLLHRAERHRTAHDWHLYRRARRAFTSIVRRAKATAWREFCASINKPDLWNHVRRIVKPHQRLHVEDLRSHNGEWVTEDAAKAAVLAHRFFPPGPQLASFQALSDRRREDIQQWLSEGWAEFPPITSPEIQRKLTTMRAFAAPGPDGIVARCLQEASASLVPVLRHLFQRMLREGVHPTAWGMARVLPVPKPAGDAHAAKGYRPIALLSVLSKLLEGLVRDRLSYFLESGHHLSDCQQGFRQARSTDLALWRFVTSASLALKTRHRCVAVALDIQSAYDTVDHVALLWKLREKGVPRYLVAWIRAFLARRTAQLVVNESVFPFDIHVGVPQGSPLSPTLFLVFVDDLLQDLEQLVRLQAFADDILLWDITTYRGPCPPRVQEALRVVESWSHEWGLTFNVAKCQAIDISTLRRRSSLELRMHDALVTQVQEFRYLGVWVDSSLSWARQIRESCCVCLTRLRVLRRLCATYWGLHPQVVEVLVKALVFPRLFYGVSAWGGAVRYLARLRPIDRVLRMAAVVTLGLLRTTSAVKALAVCGWLPADLAIRFELVRFILRQRCYGREDLLTTDYSPGVNRVVSAIDVARRAVDRFLASSAVTREGWVHLDPLQFGVAAPWDPMDPLPVRFLQRETAQAELISVQRRQPRVWVYTDGSIQRGGGGAAAIFEDVHGPFGRAHLPITLGPLQSSTDAELAGIRLALDHLASRTDWHQAYIVSDSQAALLQLCGVSWRRTRASIWEVFRRALTLRQAGRHLELWWAPGHAGIEGNETADSVARAAASGVRSGTEPFSVSRSMLDHHLLQWYHSQAQAQVQGAQAPGATLLEDSIVCTDLHWTRLMPSRFMAARVAQFLTGHFPTGTYLYRFHLRPSPLCECCQVEDTRGHLLLFCQRWTLVRQRLSQWLEEDSARRSRVGYPQPEWTWAFLVGSNAGRLWLGRFLVAVRPRWTMRDQFRVGTEEGTSDQE